MIDYTPLRFIGEEIEVQFDKTPTYEKNPPCPASFTWKGNSFRINKLLNEWYDFSRKGDMSRNMRPKNAQRASLRGSWGVGRFYFRVRTNKGKIYDLYYDRAAKSVDHRKGYWVLFRELLAVVGGDQ